MSSTPLAATPPRRLTITHFSPWAGPLMRVDRYLETLPTLDLRPRVAEPDNEDMLRAARLDCDWHGESSRAFAAMQYPGLEFGPAFVTGAPGLLDLARAPAQPGEERWLVFDGQGPQRLAAVAEKLVPLLVRAGLRIAWYAFDEVSRTTSVFKILAPHLSVLIHDESPLDAAGAARLSPACVRRHRSWVANVLPFHCAFEPQPEEKIVFLGSKLGLTEHRRRQIEFLQTTFKDRFLPIYDHSVPVSERAGLNRYKVSLCPEGRKFVTPGMAQTHTDRPFWSGCLGMVPVSENSVAGGRLDSLAADGLIQRYPHGDFGALKLACERALAATVEERKRIYGHFNRHETVGTVLAEALHAVPI